MSSASPSLLQIISNDGLIALWYMVLMTARVQYVGVSSNQEDLFIGISTFWIFNNRVFFLRIENVFVLFCPLM